MWHIWVPVKVGFAILAKTVFATAAVTTVVVLKRHDIRDWFNERCSLWQGNTALQGYAEDRGDQIEWGIKTPSGRIVDRKVVNANEVADDVRSFIRKLDTAA
jgi:hypothetical protein